MRARAALRRTVAAFVLSATMSPGTSAAVVADPPPDWAADAVAYVRDPGRNRALVRRFAGQDPESLPPLVRLLLADARFRSGSDRAAAGLAERALAGLPGTAGSLPYVLLGMVAFAQDDLPRLDDLLLRADGVTLEARLAVLLLAGLASSTRDARASALLFERLADDESIPPDLRPAFRQAAGLTALWAGDPGRALSAFERLAAGADAGVLADNARYGWAVARWHAGDSASAIAGLEELAAAPEAGRRPRRPTAGQALLEQRATLRGMARRLRHHPTRVAPLAAQITGAFDSDTAGLAARALEVFSGGDMPGPETAAGGTGGRTTRGYPAGGVPPPAPERLGSETGNGGSPGKTPWVPREPTPDAAGRSMGRFAAFLALAAAMALAGRVARRVWGFRRAARSPTRAARATRPSPAR